MTTKKTPRPKLVKFEPSARIQGLLGRELISSDYVAVAEAVRNAYDAGAKEITITLYPNHPQKLVIADSGSGMSLTDFQNLWMTPGYSAKADSQKINGRVPLGEKGIGRFAVDKLSSKLVLVTKKRSDSEPLRAQFDWTRFEDQTKKLRDIKIRVHRVKDQELISQGHGTRLELLNLRKKWTHEDWTALRNELKKLICPSGQRFGFRLEANASGWESGLIIPDFDGEGAYKFVFTINKRGHVVWSLTRPAKILDQLREQGVTAKKVESGTDTVTNSFGFMDGQFYFFPRPARIKAQGYDSGVGIYRDGFRVEPYGRGNDDWLEVKSLRAKHQGHAPVSPSKLFGFIQISRAENPKLKDLTNREGIQGSLEFDEFRQEVIGKFQHFATFIANDKSKLPLAPTIRGQRASHTRLTRAEAFGEMADQLAHQLRQPMSHIANTVNTLQAYLGTSTEDKKLTRYIDRIVRNVYRLNADITGLSELAGNLKIPISEIDLLDLLDELVAAHKPNFDQHTIDLSVVTKLVSAVATFSKPALEFAINNYLDNALKATAEAKNSTKHQVTLKLTKIKTNRFRIAVEDSGDGISSEQGKILFTKPVLSSSGSGIGLYFSRLHIDQFDGRVGFEPTKEGTSFFVEIPGLVEKQP